MHLNGKIAVVLCLLVLIAQTSLADHELAFHMPHLPCTEEVARNSNMILARTDIAEISTMLKCGARNTALGGAKNLIGCDDRHIVNSLVTGCQGSMMHSNAALFSYGGKPSASLHNHEFRVSAMNGARFHDTQVTAAAYLVQDDASARLNQMSLSAYLISQGTTATARLGALDTRHYQWKASYSPETRYRYGFTASQATQVDAILAPSAHSYANETSAAPIAYQDDELGICQLDISGPLLVGLDPAEPAVIDLVSTVTLMAEAIRELSARLDALEG